ncbi:MAG TPA: glycoside hydrolase family 15 protein [Pyrinomonadaceae bacterium]|nr:glycoside hydrolase family 15 protein [Pyrinomonadaceae bacterium]
MIWLVESEADLELNQPSRFTLALSFGHTTAEATANARASLRRGFDDVQRAYKRGWHSYLRPLRRVASPYQDQFNMALMVLKALEDKTNRGATIASPSSPWGGGPNANEATVTGYHAVWSRDLYHVATAFLAAGDRASAERALNFLFHKQQRADGSFPQNSRVDGRQIGGGLQMDQVALPLVLAYQLGRTDLKTWRDHVKISADLIVEKGPSTEQERWEEEKGYSPSTIAGEIAALVCAAHIAQINRDVDSAGKYLAKADEWAKTVNDWTATKTGGYHPGHYRQTPHDRDTTRRCLVPVQPRRLWRTRGG